MDILYVKYIETLFLQPDFFQVLRQDIQQGKSEGEVVPCQIRSFRVISSFSFCIKDIKAIVSASQC